MAETSGFFQAMMDESIGDYDRKYLASQFANYFSLFIKNGVFGSPTNQLLVVPGEGLSLVVKPGHAFINGYWYENDSDKVIPLVPNYGTGNRTDTVRVRMSHVTRDMTVDVYTDDTELVRGEDVYDLQLATVTVQPMASTLLASAIQDTRPNQEVCGFVTGLMSVQTTADLFAQYQAMFDEWFEDVKGTLSENAVGNLLERIDDVEDNVMEVMKPIVNQTLQVGLREIVILPKQSTPIYMPQTIDYTLPEVYPEGQPSQKYYMHVPMYFVEYVPTGYSVFAGRVAIALASASGSAYKDASCSSVVPKRYTNADKSPSQDADPTLRSYCRIVRFNTSNFTMTIMDNKEVSLTSQTYPMYGDGITNNDVNGIVYAMGLGYYCTTKYNVVVTT